MRDTLRQVRSEMTIGTLMIAPALLAHPSRPLLFSGSFDGCIRIWDLETRALLRKLSGHIDTVWGLALDSSGTCLASGSDDGSVQVWDAESGEHLRTLVGHSRGVFAVAWEAAGSLLASGSVDKTVRVWDVVSGTVLRTLEGHTETVGALVAHPIDGLFASGSNDQSVRVWRFSSGECLRTLAGHTGWVTSLAASKEWLISGSMDRTMRVWSWETGVCARVIETTNTLSFNSLARRDSRMVALEGDGTVRVWDTGSSDPLAWSCAGSLNVDASLMRGIAAAGGGRTVLNAGWGHAVVACETPLEARARRRRRLARAR